MPPRKYTQVEDNGPTIMVHFWQTVGTTTAIHESREYNRRAEHWVVWDCLRWSQDQEPCYGKVSNPEENYTHCVDGYEFPDIESNQMADGKYPPFRIFDIKNQAYLDGEYPDRESATKVMKQIPNSVTE